MNTVIIIQIIVLVLFLTSVLYLILDFLGPKKIQFQPTKVFGIECLRAKDLIIQDFDNNCNLLASRGMVIYQYKKDVNKFIRIAHVPTGFSVLWLNNFRIFRRFSLKPECQETIVTKDGKISAFSAGFIWYGEINEGKFRKTLRLSHYGIGVGRGILSNGLLKVNDNLIFFGEYFRNDERTSVRIFKSKDFGQTWEIAFEFQPGKIKHIHSLQRDPFTGKLWLCTGDENDESIIGWSDNYFNNINSIGHGSQIWRACQLVFTEEAVYWGTDTDSDEAAGIYRWDKKSLKLTKLQKIQGAVFFATRLANGTIVMSTDREDYSIEEDDKTRMYIIGKGDKISTITCGTWNHKKLSFRYNYAKLRIQRGQGNESLYVSCLNQKEIPDGDLVVFSENVLIQN
jgi:hypothetical protein